MRGAGRGLGPLLTLLPGGAGFPGLMTTKQKAGGWRGAGAQSTSLLSFSLWGPQLLRLGKIDRVEKAKLAGKATWWVKIPAEEQFSPELGRGWLSGKNVL